MSEYAMSRVVMLTGFQFMYGLGQALGGLTMPPFSEALGREKSYLLSDSVSCISSLLVGLVSSPIGVFIGRFFSGFASSVPAIVLAASIEDMYTQRPRLWLLSFWNCSTMLGIAVGPIYGSYIVDAIGWSVSRRAFSVYNSGFAIAAPALAIGLWIFGWTVPPLAHVRLYADRLCSN